MNIFKSLFGGGTSNEELINAIKEGAYIVDVRSPGEFSYGTAKGAVNIPLDKVAAQVAKFKGKKSVVLFCASGNRSGQAKSILESKGIQNVFNGGSWQNVKRLVEESKA